jgi:hypothetical protein
MKKMQEKIKGDTNIQGKSKSPPQTKVNQTKRQTQRKMPTPPEVENTRFYLMSLDKPRPLNRHNKKNVDHQNSPSHSMGRNHPTEGHVYMRNEHHDEANMGRNQNIDIKSLALFWTKTI